MLYENHQYDKVRKIKHVHYCIYL